MKVETTQNCMEEVYEMLHNVSAAPGKDECSVCTDLLAEKQSTLGESTREIRYALNVPWQNAKNPPSPNPFTSITIFQTSRWSLFAITTVGT
jgi:hypothetical protein